MHGLHSPVDFSPRGIGVGRYGSMSGHRGRVVVREQDTGGSPAFGKAEEEG